uniref:Uncharacterized protein n=1 Tax=Rhizophora mucronata TaxID=61149 RepID=A0A2P2J9L1_RHIMU
MFHVHMTASKFQVISTSSSERAEGTAANANTMAQRMVSRALLSAGTKPESVDTATTTPVAAIKPSSKAAVSDRDADTTNVLAVSDRYANGLNIV